MLKWPTFICPVVLTEIWKSVPNPQDTDIKVINIESNPFKRKIKEAIYIQVNDPLVNRNIGKYNLPPSYDKLMDGGAGGKHLISKTVKDSVPKIRLQMLDHVDEANYHSGLGSYRYCTNLQISRWVRAWNYWFPLLRTIDYFKTNCVFAGIFLALDVLREAPYQA